MKNYLFLSFLLFFTSLHLSAQSTGKREHVVQDVKATKVAGARGAVTGLGTVPATDSAAAYAECDCGCDVVFDNYTGYWINIYVDSVFKGTLEPYAQGTLWVNPGSKSWYAETTGGTYYWKGNQNCADAWWIKFWE